MPAVSELVASGRTVEEVARLIAQTGSSTRIEDLIAACKHEDARIQEFDTSCFSGEYVTGDVTPNISSGCSWSAPMRRSTRGASGAPNSKWCAGAELADAPDPRRELLLGLLQAGLQRVDGRRCVREGSPDSLLRLRAYGWLRSQGRESHGARCARGAGGAI